MTQQERRQLVVEIARALGPGWTLAPSVHGVFYDLQRRDGAEMTLSFRTPDRVEVFGRFPSWDGQTFNPLDGHKHITCAIARGAAAIAGDIERRWLPWYLSEYNQALARLDDQRRAIDWERDTVREFAEILSGDVLTTGDNARVYINRFGAYGEVTASSYAERVTFDVTMPVDAARVVARAIARELARLSNREGEPR